MNALAPIGHNNPPDPLDEALAPWGDTIAEAEMWLDGEAIDSDDKMKVVDRIAGAIREARRSVENARAADVDPLHAAWKERVAHWRPTVDDLARIQKGLAATAEAFKRQRAAEKDAARRAAEAEAERARQAAEDARDEARAGDIEAQRAAAAAVFEAREAERQAARARADGVKGLRLVTLYEITDLSALLRWVAVNDREALAAFANDYARAHHRDGVERPGLRVWQERKAV